MQLLKTKPAKIAMAACAALAMLAAVFFLQPGPGKSEIPITLPELTQEETALLTQQAQGVAIDIDAVLRQTQAEATNTSLLPSTQSTAAVLQTLTTLQPTAVAATTILRTQAVQPVTSTAPATTTAKTTTTTSTISTTVTTTTTTTTAKAQLTCTISVRCNTVLDKLDRLSPAKKDIVPASGVILQSRTVSFTEGESVFDVLKRVTQSERIHMDFDNNPMYNSAYIAAIANLYERDCGELSGWMYRVNGVFPGYGCGKYTLKQGDAVEWLYTCDLGKDIGGEGITQR